jgi:hypothetical protein
MHHFVIRASFKNESGNRNQDNFGLKGLLCIYHQKLKSSLPGTYLMEKEDVYFSRREFA